MNGRFKHFKEYFEKKREKEKWKVFYKEELPEKVTETRTVYFVITGDTLIKKQKTVYFSIFYVASRKREGLLEFREEIQSFIKEDLETQFETEGFYNSDGYEIDYSISDERKTLRIAEIKCSYDYTTLYSRSQEFPLMKNLNDKIVVKED